MNTYIFTQIAYRRDIEGYYVMASCVNNGVFANKDKAIEKAENQLNYFHSKYGGIVTEHSKFDREVFNQTVEMGNVKATFIVTENEVIE